MENEKKSGLLGDPFCVFPFQSLNIMPSGQVKPCCAFGEVIQQDGRPMSVYEHSVHEIWSSDYMRDLRRDMLDGKPVKNCVSCYKQEKGGASSMGTNANLMWRQANPDVDAKSWSFENYAMPSGLEYFDLDIGNLCNLKCRMCNSSYSSAIASDKVHSAWAPPGAVAARWKADRSIIAPRISLGVSYDGFDERVHQDGVLRSWITKRAGLKAFTSGVGATGFSVNIYAPNATTLKISANGIVVHDGQASGRFEMSFEIPELNMDAQLELEILTNERIAIEEIALLRSSRGNSRMPLSRLPGGDPWYESEDFMGEELLNYAKSLRKIRVIGGEPLLIKEAKSFLQRLVDEGVSSDIVLRLATNGMQADDAWLEMFSHFKDTGVTVSIDGVSAVTEYIRYPSKWETVDANIRKLANTPNTSVHTNMTVQAYNLLNIVEMFEYCQEQNITFGYFVLQGPSYLSAKAVPDSVRELAVKRLRDYVSENSAVSGKRNSPAMLTALAGAIEAHRFSLEDNLKFNIFTAQLDESRSQSLKKSIPELWELMN